MRTQTAEIVYFKLKTARSYRFYGIPSTRIMDLREGQILRVVDRRDIEYFRAKSDVLVECDKHGVDPHAPLPGTISTPNALTKRLYKGTEQSDLARGTRVVGSPLQAAQNPTAVQKTSAYSQRTPGVHIPRSPQAMAPVAPPAPAVSPHAATIVAPGGMAARKRVYNPAPAIPPSVLNLQPTVQYSIPERPQAPAPPPLAVQHPGAVDVENQTPVAQEVAEASPRTLPIAAESQGVIELEGGSPAAPVAAAQPVQQAAPRAPVPEHLLAKPIPQGGLTQAPTIVGGHAPGQMRQAQAPTVMPAPGTRVLGQPAPTVVGGTESGSSPGSQALFHGGQGVPEPSMETQKILRDHDLAGTVVETTIESVDQKGNISGEYR